MYVRYLFPTSKDLNMFYSPGQFRHILPFVDGVPNWLLLGGPGSGNEAQCAVEEWPTIRVIGIEPNHEAREWQLDNGWPAGHLLLPHALWSTQCEMPLLQSDSHLRLCQARLVQDGEESTGLSMVPTITLDVIDSEYGPFEDALLWIDIEGAEYQALQGATGLLKRKAIMALSVEESLREPARNRAMEDVLSVYGYNKVHESEFNNPNYRDCIFVRSGS